MKIVSAANGSALLWFQELYKDHTEPKWLTEDLLFIMVLNKILL